jgi:hypothetical protein
MNDFAARMVIVLPQIADGKFQKEMIVWLQHCSWDNAVSLMCDSSSYIIDVEANVVQQSRQQGEVLAQRRNQLQHYFLIGSFA